MQGFDPQQMKRFSRITVPIAFYDVSCEFCFWFKKPDHEAIINVHVIYN